MNLLSKIFGNNSGKDLPAFARSYLDSCRNIDQSSLLENIRFVVFDTETTSLDAKTARLLSISAVSCTHNKIEVSSALDCYVAWADESRPENIAIHGITKRQSNAGLQPEEVIEVFLNYIKGAVLVAQHIDFDVAIVNKVLHKYYPGLKIKNYLLDTAQLAIRLEQPRMSSAGINPKDYTLDALLDRYGIEPLERHTALGDAYSTAELLIRLLPKLRKRGLKKLGDFLKR
ncbi:3'-5' exonuclease [Fulvivirga sp. 29W222]|uniref:3'-5' exonuclease n=1 Tax=Fulvivirga marina TaxID=2494733 RepID=A0A937KDW3_9BACT|nr:3'-5' exonuclease [Fulvivirga marina]MBL6446628.1 3'-5' exonuclease [Fulvivirga marina]